MNCPGGKCPGRFFFLGDYPGGNYPEGNCPLGEVIRRKLSGGEPSGGKLTGHRVNTCVSAPLLAWFYLRSFETFPVVAAS